MAEPDMRTRIKDVAVDHFNRDGYHGATIRNIARDAGCSLPMVNYYFQSKKELFHEIIKTDYFALLNRQATGIKAKPGDSLLDFYTEFVYGLSHLSERDSQIYRLGIKVYLGFDGDEELMAVMDEWEKTIMPRHHKLIAPYLKKESNDIVIVRTLVHLLETLVDCIVVKGRHLSEQEIREELSVVLPQ